MDLEFFKVGSSQVLLVIEFFDEITVHINLLQVIYEMDLLAFIDSLIVV